MTFPDIAAKPALTAQSRGGFLLPQTKEIWLTGHLWNIEYCLLEVKIWKELRDCYLAMDVSDWMIMLKEKYIFLSNKSKNHFSLNSYTGDCQMH